MSKPSDSARGKPLDSARGKRVPGWRSAVPRLQQFILEHLLLLPLGAAIALVWVNVSAETYYPFVYAVAFAVNDVAMMFFFAVMMKEVVEATAPGGVLHPWRRALLPMIAAVGGAVVPALIYVRLVGTIGEPMLADAWPVSLAVDIAVTYFVARVVFEEHPAVPFVLLLAIASDALAFVVLSVKSPTVELRLGVGALLMAMALAIGFGLRRLRVRSFWPYLLLAGGVSWWALYWSGLHPALALIPVVPFLPHGARDPGFFVDADPNARDALSQFEVWWRYPAQVALFFFGLVNAGVPLGALEEGTYGMPVAVLVGRPLGIVAAAAVAIALGLHLPQRVRWRELLVVGFAAAVGFSFGLFLSTALVPPGQLRSETGMGVLLTLTGAPLAILAARVLRVGRFSR